MNIKSEDSIRDSAKIILGFDHTEKEVNQGTGQITTFNSIDNYNYKGINDKPDGWYIPQNKAMPALILETKSSDKNLDDPQIQAELLKNVDIVLSTHKKCIGILYNGDEVKVFDGHKELENISKKLEHKSYYLKLAYPDTIDKQKIYNLTKRINDSLHTNFGIKNLNHRMIFTACALVACRYGATLYKGMAYSVLHNSILNTLNKSLEKSKAQNIKLGLLETVYSEIKMNINENQEAIDDFIECVEEISNCVNSDNWHGEDVMGIFFNEFNRYKGKSDAGQIFTPDHITSFMCRVLNVDEDDRVLDAACGSGAFLVKAMSNMIKQAGGVNTQKAKQIKQNQLFGVEFDREIFALCAANFLIHKDGKTNIIQDDTRSQEVGVWIKDKDITKVLMNPPYERKYGCIDIVKNVLDNVPKHTLCGFLLPDTKLDKESKSKAILKNHTVKKIIKLPENTFFKVGVTVSLFIFEAGVPQDGKEIFGCYIEEDGLETVKNQGRQDIHDRWPALEDYWVDVIRKQSGDDTIQWIDPSERLSYKMPEAPFVLYEEDFVKTVMDYEMFKCGIDAKELEENLAKNALYSSDISYKHKTVNVSIKAEKDGNNE